MTTRPQQSALSRFASIAALLGLALGCGDGGSGSTTSVDDPAGNGGGGPGGSRPSAAPPSGAAGSEAEPDPATAGSDAMGAAGEDAGGSGGAQASAGGQSGTPSGDAGAGNAGGPNGGSGGEPPASVVDCDGPLQFPDPALRQMVVAALLSAGLDLTQEEGEDLIAGGDILPETSDAISELNSGYAGSTLESLQGIQCLVRLSSLYLVTQSAVTDLAPVATLPKLNRVALNSSVVDVSPLGSVTARARQAGRATRRRTT